MKAIVQIYSPIITPKHVNGIPVCHNSVLASPAPSKYRMNEVFDEWHHEKLQTHLSTRYLAPTNSSHGGSLLQRWTVSKGPKLSVKYSTLSEQLWSKSTLGATFVDLQDIVANSSNWSISHSFAGTRAVKAIVHDRPPARERVFPKLLLTVWIKTKSY